MPDDQIDIVFSNPGRCPCCRSDTTFVAHRDWLRDYYLCATCGSIPRQRHVQHVLDTRFPGWERVELHESSPSNDFLARFCTKYSSSQYLPGVALGATREATRCESVEALTFPDESFDLFVTQDVLEHVFDPAAAIADIHRVLRPGGAHVFTAPKHKNLLVTVRRAALSPDGTVEHIQPEEYHGNPVGDGRALVTYDYGYDFEALLSTWSGVSVEAVHTLDRFLGLDADFNEVFVIRKPRQQAQQDFSSTTGDGAAPHRTLSSRLRPYRTLPRRLVRKASRMAKGVRPPAGSGP